MKVAILFLIFSLCSCNNDTSSDKQRINLTGSSTVAPLVAELAQTFEKEHPGIQVDVQTGGSSRGIADARQHSNDVGMVSRALKPQEHDLTAYLIARDGVGVIVNKNTNITNITKSELIKMFTKKVVNWSHFRQPKQKIVVIHKAQGRSTAEVFLDYLQLPYGMIQADIIIGDNEQGIKNVANIPGSIGYVSIGAAEAAIAQGVPIRLLNLEGVSATTANVANGKYPIRRELNLVVPKNKELNAATRKFINFMISKKTSPVVKDLDFVPIQI